MYSSSTITYQADRDFTDKTKHYLFRIFFSIKTMWFYNRVHAFLCYGFQYIIQRHFTHWNSLYCLITLDSYNKEKKPFPVGICEVKPYFISSKINSIFHTLNVVMLLWWNSAVLFTTHFGTFLFRIEWILVASTAAIDEFPTRFHLWIIIKSWKICSTIARLSW